MRSGEGPMLRRGDLVLVEDMVAAVAAVAGAASATIAGDVSVLEGHVVVWLGAPHTSRTSRSDEEGDALELWMVPTAHCQLAPKPILRHEGPGGGSHWDRIKELFGGSAELSRD